MVTRSSSVLVVYHVWDDKTGTEKYCKKNTKRKTQFSHTLAAPAKDVPENKKTATIKPKIQLTAEVLVKIACSQGPGSYR